MKTNLRMTTGLVLFTAFTSVVMAPVASFAGSVGKRNTAIGLTAATIYAAAKGKSTAALAVGAGTAYAWKRYADSKKKTSYYRGYRRGAATYYNRGYHKGYYKGRRAHGYKKVYYRQNGRLHYCYRRA